MVELLVGEAQFGEGFKSSWVYRAITATKGNQTQMGAILIAALGRQPKNPPYFQGKATITSDGFLMCNFVDKDGVLHPGALVSDDEDFVRNSLRLSEHCGMTDGERVEFLAKINDWIETDHRSPERIRRVLQL